MTDQKTGIYTRRPVYRPDYLPFIPGGRHTDHCSIDALAAHTYDSAGIPQSKNTLLNFDESLQILRGTQWQEWSND